MPLAFSPTRRQALAQGLAIPLAAALPAFGQSYPTRPITAMVGYPPGGGGDFVARAIAGRMQKTLGQTIVIENRGGAGGTLAVQKMVNAAPDGYTILMGTVGELIQAPMAMSSARYRSEDLKIVGKTCDSYLYLLARPDLPANNLTEFIALAKSKSDRPLSFAHLGRGSAWHLAAEKLMRDADIKMLPVPYRGGAQLFPDLMSGVVDVAFLGLGGPLLGMIQKGQMKAIGSASPKRQTALPNVPTFEESHVGRDFVFSYWQACMVSRSTPEAVVQRLHPAVVDAINDPQVRSTLEGSGLLPTEATTLAESARFFDAEIQRYRAIAQAINLQPE